MTNEDKAMDIAEYNTRYYGSEFDSYKECKQSALDMAKWKDQQYEEEKHELRGLVEMLQVDYLFALDNDKSKEITEKGREYVRKMCEEFNLKID